MLDKSNVVKMSDSLEMLGFLKTNGTQCRFVAITTKTPVVKIKVGNPWGASAKSKNGLYKCSHKIGVINANYCNSVARRIAAKLGVKENEVEYTPGETWYHHLMTADNKALPVVEHKDETKRGSYYLQYFPQTDKSINTYVNEAGEPVNADEVKPWLYAESARPDFKPCVIAVNLTNVHRLAATGVIIEMPELEEVEAALAD